MLPPVHHTEGPRVRLGLAWFVVTVGLALVDRRLLAVWLGGAAGWATHQLLGVWQRRGGAWSTVDQRVGRRRRRPVFVAPGPLARGAAVAAAAAVPLGAVGGSDGLLAAATAGTVAVAVAQVADVAGGWAPHPGGPGSITAGVGGALAGAFVLGLGAAGPVLAHRLGVGAALVLVVLVAVYDASDYLVGSGATTVWEGPAAGIAAITVITFSFAVLALPPLGLAGTLRLGAVVALLAPAGPPAATLLVGDRATRVPALRRVDSLLVVGPVWASWAAASVG